jgi:hypothetical protein
LQQRTNDEREEKRAVVKGAFFSEASLTREIRFSGETPPFGTNTALVGQDAQQAGRSTTFAAM